MLFWAQRADVGSIRAVWAIQDRIALDAEEEIALELKRDVVAAQERVVWNPGLSLAAKEFELTPAKVGRIRAALEGWDSYSAGTDRRWLEPVLVALFETEVPNNVVGHPQGD